MPGKRHDDPMKGGVRPGGTDPKLQGKPPKQGPKNDPPKGGDKK